MHRGISVYWRDMRHSASLQPGRFSLTPGKSELQPLGRIGTGQTTLSSALLALSQRKEWIRWLI